MRGAGVPLSRMGVFLIAKLSTTALYAFVSITLMQKSYNEAHPSAA